MKMRVHTAVMEDMKKYVKDLDLRQYEEWRFETDPEVIDFLRNYYDEHLPVDITAWARVNKPSQNLKFGNRQKEQIVFVRDTIGPLLHTDYYEYLDEPPMVINTIKSKEVVLPIYLVSSQKYGIELVLQNNFFGWKVSVASVKPLEFDTMDLFDTKRIVPSILCQGFPKDRIYGSYDQDKMHFTVEISDQFNLYTFVYILRNYLRKV